MSELRAVTERERERSAHRAGLHHQIGDRDVAERANSAAASHPLAQRSRYRRTGVQEVDVAAAPATVTRSRDLSNATVGARPADAPAVHLAHPVGRRPAQRLREPRIAQTAARREGVGKVVFPGIRLLLGESGGDGHLCHHRRSTTSDHVLVGEDDPGAIARRGKGCVHARTAGADDQHVGAKMRSIRAAQMARPRHEYLPPWPRLIYSRCISVRARLGGRFR